MSKGVRLNDKEVQLHRIRFQIHEKGVGGIQERVKVGIKGIRSC